MGKTEDGESMGNRSRVLVHLLPVIFSRNIAVSPTCV